MTRGARRRHAPGATRVPIRDERGLVSLAEVLVAMAIIGLAAVAIVSGYGVANLSASHHQEITRADHVARLVAEHIQGQAYVPCAGPEPPEYDLSGVPFPQGWGASNVSLTFAYWDGNVLPGTTSPSFLPVCPGDVGLQRITVEVTSPADRGDRVIGVLKRGLG